jgi:hypothetical protein
MKEMASAIMLCLLSLHANKKDISLHRELGNHSMTSMGALISDR